jgi:hypothetical protein
MGMTSKERTEALAELDRVYQKGLAKIRKTYTGDDLVIEDNVVGIEAPCPLCGGEYNPDCGPELFLRGTGHPVCHACGDRLNPALMQELRRESARWQDEYDAADERVREAHRASR